MENHHAINGKIHYKWYKWPFSIAMLVHQRVLFLVLASTGCACEAQHALDIRQVQKQQPRKVGSQGAMELAAALVAAEAQWLPSNVFMYILMDILM